MIDSDDREAMAAYIAAAERYFQELAEPERLFDKPFVPVDKAGYNVARLGYLLHHLRARPGHTVVDFGAGLGWLTIVLLRTGCHAVALDVSTTALALARRAMAAAGLPADAPAARFVTYDGFRMPIDDASVDRVACYDALHHVPNKRTVLREIHRVLRDGGRACFVEPGPGHAASGEARTDVDEWGVLEDEVDAAALCTMAQEVGFARAQVVPLPLPADNALDPEGFRTLWSARDRSVAWTGNDALVVLEKGGWPDSRSPERLAAAIDVLDAVEHVAPGAEMRVRLRVVNTGDTRWLAMPAMMGDDALDYEASFLTPGPVGTADAAPLGVYRRFIERHGLQGRVTVGARLWPVGAHAPLDADYGRGFLTMDLAPGDGADVAMRLRAPSAPGLYRVTFDGVDEYVTWFSAPGAAPAAIYLRVGDDGVARDSRQPGRLVVAWTLVERGDGRAVVAVRNDGDTAWLASPLAEGGWVRLGVQRLDAAGQVADRDWRRVMLPADVLPGDTVRMAIEGLHEAEHGVRLDLVSELRTWFADAGSMPLIITPQV